MEEVIMEVKGLKKYFPVTAGIIKREVASVKAVNGIDFLIRRGEILGMVGESGSGKSTAGRASIRLIEPTAGEITFLGKDLLSMAPSQLFEIRKKVQMVFQDPYASLNPRKRILDSVGEALIYHKIISGKENQADKVAETLAMVGLPPDAMYRYPHQFSGGQQQRICIARSIILGPKLIICDEAVSALDVSVQAQIMNLLLGLRKELNLSYLFISHDLSVIRYLCDRVIVLYLGKVMESASVRGIFENPKHPYTKFLLSANPKSHPGETKHRLLAKGEIPSALNPPSGCPFRTRCPYAQPICAEEPPVKRVLDPSTGKEDHIYHCILD